RVIAERGERRSKLRRFETLIDLSVEPVDHRARRAHWRQEPSPTGRDKPGKSALGHRRQVRQLRDMFGTGRGELAKLAASNEWQGHARAPQRHLQLTGGRGVCSKAAP